MGVLLFDPIPDNQKLALTSRLDATTLDRLSSQCVAKINERTEAGMSFVAFTMPLSAAWLSLATDRRLQRDREAASESTKDPWILSPSLDGFGLLEEWK
jgi:hypothetical protein